MRQRVMIAMALSCEPELVIADEPTTALDMTIQAQILELLQRLTKDKGTSVILITHDLGVVAGMADDVVVMYAGKVMERGLRRSSLMLRRTLIQKVSLCRCPTPLPSVGSSIKYRARRRTRPICRPAVPSRRAVKWRRRSAEKSHLPWSRLRQGGQHYAILVKQTMKPLVAIRNLEVHFDLGGGRRVVKAVDGFLLDIRPGEVLGLVGESGCGKTTFGRSILQFVEPRAEGGVRR